MDNYFPEWKAIRSSKTKRISPSGVSIPVKLYYEKQEVQDECTEVIESDLPEEWKDQSSILSSKLQGEKSKKIKYYT